MCHHISKPVYLYCIILLNVNSIKVTIFAKVLIYTNIILFSVDVPASLTSYICMETMFVFLVTANFKFDCT